MGAAAKVVPGSEVSARAAPGWGAPGWGEKGWAVMGKVGEMAAVG